MALDTPDKFLVVNETVAHAPAVVPPVVVIAERDRLDGENPRWPWDADVKAGRTFAVDCETLKGGSRYAAEESEEDHGDKED